MFGSLMMFASGVLASSPSSASASGSCPNCGEDAARERDVAQLDVDAGGPGERLDDRQEASASRGRAPRPCTCRSPSCARTRYHPGILVGMAFVPPARHLLRAKDLADARYAEPLDVDDMAAAAGLSRAHFSREFRARSAIPRTSTCSPAGSSGRRRCCGSTDRSVADICLSVGLQSVGSFTTSFTRTYGDVADRLPARPARRRPPTRRAELRRARLRAAGAGQHVWRRRAARRP